MVQFSGGSVTISGGILYFSRARAREGFGDISGILAVFGGGRAAADDFAIFEKGYFFARIDKVSIPLYAGGRPVLRNICKIAKFVDTAENRSKRVLLRIS